MSEVAAVDRSPIEERAIDDELADSFPASDPPSWTSVVAETGPPRKQENEADQATTHDSPLAGED